MENYKRYKEAYPHKTDAQIIESLAWELSSKVETISQLLAENEALRKPAVSGRSELLCGFFEADNKTSSATKCKCGREKWEHPKAT